MGQPDPTQPKIRLTRLKLTRLDLQLVRPDPPVLPCLHKEFLRNHTIQAIIAKYSKSLPCFICIVPNP